MTYPTFESSISKTPDPLFSPLFSNELPPRSFPLNLISWYQRKIRSLSPWERNVRVLPQISMSVILFGSRVFAEVTELRWGHTGWPSSNDRCPYKKQESSRGHTERKAPCEDRGRDFSDVAAKPRDAQGCQQPLETSREGSNRVQKGANTVAPWFLTSGVQNCEITNFGCIKPPSLWDLITAALGN